MGKKYSRAFTLTELIIVVSIISFLAVMAMAYFRSQIFKGNDARRKADIKKIQIALEEYEKDHDCYPPAEFVVCEPGDGLLPYMSQIPCDPTSDTSYLYDYENDACPGWYRIYTKLEYAQDPNITPGIGPGSLYNYYQGSPNSPQ